MRLSQIIIENFRCFKNQTIDFCSTGISGQSCPSGGMTVFVAGNGQGKTAVLEAIRYLLGQFIARFPKNSVTRFKNTDYREEWEYRSNLFEQTMVKLPREPYMRLYAQAEFFVPQRDSAHVEWDIVQRRDKTSNTAKALPPLQGVRKLHEFADTFIENDNAQTPLALPVLAYYNTERAVIRNKPERRRNLQKAFNRYGAYLGALEDGLNYKKMIEWFCYLEDKQRREREIVRDFDYQTIEHKTIQLAIEKMLPGFTNLRTVVKPLDLIVDIAEEENVKSCRINDQLSDGYKIVLVMVLDIVSRILEANGCLKDMTPEALLQSNGIVLIDEVDLHLHPSWQQRILGDLQRTFPNIQFIVTTHSPQVVSSVPKECLRVIEEGQIAMFSTPTQGVEISDILRGIFGTNPIAQNNLIAQKLNCLHTMIAEGKGNSDEWTALYAELESYYGKDYPPLLGAKEHRDFIRNIQSGGDNA